MNWLKRLFKKGNEHGRIKEPVFLGEQVPINQSEEFINHNRLIKKHFSFLLSKYNFKESSSSWCDYEFHTIYTNNAVEIAIVFLPSDMPWVGIKKVETEQLGNPYHNIANLGNSNVFGEIYNLRFSRLKPKVDRFHSRIKYDNVHDRSEIEEDYQKWGKKEQELFLNEYARLIKENPSILVGNFSLFENTT